MSKLGSRRKLVAALAVRNKSSRLYAKPLQNIDVENDISILDNIISCLKSVSCIDKIVLGVADGAENLVFADYAQKANLSYIIGDEVDVLGRLVDCAHETNASDIFRVTSESPFPFFEYIDTAWAKHIAEDVDATFLDDVVDGCGFEIITSNALSRSHREGQAKHRTELCTLYIRENLSKFNVQKISVPEHYTRTDLRLTVDNPEDLILCKAVYEQFQSIAPMIPLEKIIAFLDMNEELISLTKPFTEDGYASMYVWKENVKE